MTPNDWQLLGIVVTLGVAVVGWSRANRAERHAATANEHAEASNAIAKEAITLAQSAEARADRLEQIARERRDVVWKQRPVDPRNPYTLSFQNIGTDTAYAVALVVDSAEQRFPRQSTPELGQIGPDSPIGINLTVAARDAAEQGTTLRDHMGLEPRIVVRGRITWRSQSGVSGVQDFDDIALAAPPQIAGH